MDQNPYGALQLLSGWKGSEMAMPCMAFLMGVRVLKFETNAYTYVYIYIY